MNPCVNRGQKRWYPLSRWPPGPGSQDGLLDYQAKRAGFGGRADPSCFRGRPRGWTRIRRKKFRDRREQYKILL